jgi:prefoldin alpha subunit
MSKLDQNKFMEAQMLNQQLQHLQQQLHSLDHQLEGLENLKSDLDSLKGQKDSKTYSSLNGGVFVESEIKESNSVLLNVGANVLVKKKKEEALELIENQLKELKQIRVKLENEVNKLGMHMMSLQ